MRLVLDASGKWPSAIMSGNFYELGGFSQCFDVQRYGKPYKTQYCLGQFVFDRKFTDKFIDTKDDSATVFDFLLPM